MKNDSLAGRVEIIGPAAFVKAATAKINKRFPGAVAPVKIADTCDEATEIITNAKTFPMIHKMDEGFIGTENYMGLAFFWNYEYRHTLRDASAAQLVKVHASFLANGLALDEDTEKHREIIREIFKDSNTGL